MSFFLRKHTYTHLKTRCDKNISHTIQLS